MTVISERSSHDTAETRHIDAPGVEFAYRRSGSASERPLVMLQHFPGNLDNWDAALTDALAGGREVVQGRLPRRR